MKARPSVSNLIPLALGLLCANAVNAQIFSFNFTGSLVNSIWDTGNFLPDDIQVGQSISGTITYDVSNVTDLDTNDPNNGLYFFRNAAEGDLTMTVSLVTPGHTYVFTSVAQPATMNWLNSIQVQTPADSSHFLSYAVGDPLVDGAPMPVTANGSLMGLNLSDPTRTAFASDAIPTGAPTLSSFEDVNWNLTGYTTGGVGVYGISANITSITPVPEPGEWAVIAGGLLGVFALARRRRA